MSSQDNENKTTDDVTFSTDELDDSVVAEESAQETVKKLREKLKKVTAEKQEYLNNWQRDKAEFLNARKRDKEASDQIIKFANEGIINELIPVLDSFTMAMNNKEAWEKVDKNWRTGVEYIFGQLKKALEENGLKEIDPIGQKFDPMRDEAIGFDPVTDEKLDHTITTVIQKGYSINGKALKAPKVKVGEFKK
ncbi:nucleotide exchange factor GrpE [bacterium]|nr:nucleotide exchange factor GrpE [bacterium]